MKSRYSVLATIASNAIKYRTHCSIRYLYPGDAIRLRYLVALLNFHKHLHYRTNIEIRSANAIRSYGSIFRSVKIARLHGWKRTFIQHCWPDHSVIFLNIWIPVIGFQISSRKGRTRSAIIVGLIQCTHANCVRNSGALRQVLETTSEKAETSQVTLILFVYSDLCRSGHYDWLRLLRSCSTWQKSTTTLLPSFLPANTVSKAVSAILLAERCRNVWKIRSNICVCVFLTNISS